MGLKKFLKQIKKNPAKVTNLCELANQCKIDHNCATAVVRTRLVKGNCKVGYTYAKVFRNPNDADVYKVREWANSYNKNWKKTWGKIKKS